jgi:hypothetical protein
MNKIKTTNKIMATVIAVIMISASFVFTGCQSDYEIEESTNDFSTYLELSKTDFDFARDWDNLSEQDKAIYREAKKRMEITFTKKDLCSTKWKNNTQVNISEDLFDGFVEMINVTNKTAIEMGKLQWNVKFPRLKNGSESRTDNCVVQALIYILQSFGAYSGPYGISSVDNWIYSNGYYSYDNNYGWGVNFTAPLLYYLEGDFITVNNLPSSSSGSTQYMLILTGPPAHAVVYSSRSGNTVSYYDPQNSCSGSCDISEIYKAYMATYFNHY